LEISLKSISAFDLFSGISSQDLDSMFACINPVLRNYAKNEVIAVLGHPLTGVGVVAEGEIEIARESAAGNRLIMAIAVKGETFGEMAAFSGQRVWPATVTARKDCKIILIDPDKFMGGCENSCVFHKRLIQNMLGIITRKAMQLSRKVEYLSIKSMRGKICSYLLEQSKYFQSSTFIMPMNKNDLADFLNVSRTAMSREFSRLKDEGVIDYYLSSIRLKNTDTLRKMASE
jgi:CRP-like cAMP-binding protein